MSEPIGIWALVATVYGTFAALGVPLALLGRKSQLVAKLSFGSLALLRETGLPLIGIAFIIGFPFLLTPVVSAFLLLAIGVRDPHPGSDLG
jgi:hypothetical protein